MDDLISRQAAIDALAEQIALCDKALNTFGISMKDEYAVKVEKASLVAYKEQLEFIPAAQPDIRLKKIADLVDGSIDHFDLEDAMDLLYQIKDVLK